MNTEIIVALIAFFGTLCGSAGGILVANKLVNYRIEQLEKKVEKHNNIIERMYRAEGHIEELQHDVRDLKLQQ